MPRVYVSIGSNIDKDQHIRQGVQELAAHYAPLTLSKVYESHAIGFEGDDFYNLVVGFDTQDTLTRISAVLTGIEQRCGRVRNGVRFGPRTLDLDILLYGNLVQHDDTHPLPRGEIEEYACVLRPLAEIAPNERHPETGITYRDMWRRFSDAAQPLVPVDLTLN
jgi:2-amino-4-hydroxy-6-hydroxymethyldihydropteridine diphosphokinase